jgi:hypothetical protein
MMGPVEKRPGVRYTGMIDVTLRLSRPTTPEWDVLFEEALSTDSLGRSADGIHVGTVRMIWGSVTRDQANEIDDQISDALEVANLRFRSQFLPGVREGERDRIIHDALIGESSLGR